MNVLRHLSVVGFATVVSCGCIHHETPAEARAGYEWRGSANQAISDDVQSFIRSEQIAQKDILITQYYLDRKTGRTAAVITTANTNSQSKRTDHILYYDEKNVRTGVKTIRYNHFHM